MNEPTTETPYVVLPATNDPNGTFFDVDLFAHTGCREQTIFLERWRLFALDPRAAHDAALNAFGATANFAVPYRYGQAPPLSERVARVAPGSDLLSFSTTDRGMVSLSLHLTATVRHDVERGPAQQ